MSRLLRRFAAISAAFVTAVTISGCGAVTIYSQYRELSNLELVRVVGIDAAEEVAEVTVAMSSDPEAPPEMMTRRAADLPAALEQLADNPTRRQPYYSHTEHILIGESAAQKSVAPYLDYVTRSAEMRASTSLFIVRGEAGTLIKETTDDKSSTESMLTYLVDHAADMGAGSVYTCGETSAALAGRGCALVMAVRRSESDTAQAEAPARVEPAGYAVLIDGRLAGYLEPDAARGALLLTNKFRSCITEVRDKEERKAVIELTGAKCDLTPQFDTSGVLAGIKVDLTLEGNITSLDPGCRPDNDSWRRAVEGRLDDLSESWLRAALRRSIELEADCTDLESSLRMTAPLRMDRALRKSGENESQTDFAALLPDLDIRFCTKTTLRRSFDLDTPLDVNGIQSDPQSSGIDQIMPESGETADAE